MILRTFDQSYHQLVMHVFLWEKGYVYDEFLSNHLSWSIILYTPLEYWVFEQKSVVISKF